jgi:phage terminase large subunit
MTAEFPEAFEFLFTPARYKVAFGGRGAGKSQSFARALLIQGVQQPLRILCTRETQKSIQDSVHRLLCDQIGALGLESCYSIEKARIMGANGTEFIFSGLKNTASLKSYEGLDRVWCEEGQSISKASWEILLPTVRKEGSEIWISMNPVLVNDESHVRWVVNPPPNAVVRKVNFDANPWFPEVLRVEMEYLRDTNPEAFAHVWLGECVSEVEGAIFGPHMKAAAADGRITAVPYSKVHPVHTVWDLGFGDPTSIWFLQVYDGWFNFIDYLQGDQLEISDYVIQLQNKWYVYGTDWLPHDGVDTIIHHRMAGGGDRSMSIEMLMRQAGRNPRIVPKMLITDQINAARTIFPQCRFDEKKCADGLQALRHYKWPPLSAAGVGQRKPLHDWASHAASAFQGAAVAVRQPKLEPPKKDKPRPPRLSAWS